jgi:hypothetical protein
MMCFARGGGAEEKALSLRKLSVLRVSAVNRFAFQTT